MRRHYKGIIFYFTNRPFAGYCFELGIKIDTFFSMHIDITIEGVLPTTKRVVRNGDWDGDVYSNHSYLNILTIFTGTKTITGKDGSAIKVLTRTTTRTGPKISCW